MLIKIFANTEINFVEEIINNGGSVLSLHSEINYSRKDIDILDESIKSLGSIGYKPSVKKLNSIVASKSSTQERLAAIISLGQIKDKSSITLLEKSLNDEEPNIRWDAAISLTKMNSKKGFSILEKLLTRSYYSNYPNVDENEVNNSILTILALVSKYYSELINLKISF